jgi:5-methylcytosine-specific restriction endonuclease McrA
MSYPIFGRAQPQPALEVERPKARSPELNYKWAAFAKSFLRRCPFCLECGYHGLDVMAQVVDHLVPRSQGGSLFDRDNLIPLCHAHHNKLKRDLERLAAERGDMSLLQKWMRDPRTRPGRYAYTPIDQD